MIQKQRQIFSLLVFGMLVASFQNCSPTGQNAQSSGAALSSVAYTPTPFPSVMPTATPAASPTPMPSATPVVSNSQAQVSCSPNGTVTTCCPIGYVPSGAICVAATPGISGFIAGLYRYILGRGPDVSGYNYWVGRYNSGMGAKAIANSFMQSSEFGGVVNAAVPGNSNGISAFLTALYEGILGREPDTSGEQYWAGEINTGYPTANVELSFTMGTEFQNRCSSLGITE